jgi:hypothetical protein
VSDYYTYADDTQLLHASYPSNISAAVSELENDFERISAWASSNLLKLNAGKTEFVAFHGSHMPIDQITLNLNGQQVKSKKTVKLLGVVFDETMTFSAHGDYIAGKVTGFLRMLGHCRKKIPRSTLILLVNAYVGSQLSYCLSAVSASSDVVAHYQRVQNYAIRTIYGLSRFSHVSLLRSQLGWLSVSQQASVKFALLAHKAIHGLAPRYLPLNLTDFLPQHSYSTRAKTLRTPMVMNNYGSKTFETRAVKCYRDTLSKEIWAENKVNFRKRYIIDIQNI